VATTAAERKRDDRRQEGEQSNTEVIREAKRRKEKEIKEGEGRQKTCEENITIKHRRKKENTKKSWCFVLQGSKGENKINTQWKRRFCPYPCYITETTQPI
jgi:hypothetical protein